MCVCRWSHEHDSGAISDSAPDMGLSVHSNTKYPFETGKKQKIGGLKAFIFKPLLFPAEKVQTCCHNCVRGQFTGLCHSSVKGQRAVSKCGLSLSDMCTHTHGLTQCAWEWADRQVEKYKLNKRAHKPKEVHRTKSDKLNTTGSYLYFNRPMWSDWSMQV